MLSIKYDFRSPVPKNLGRSAQFAQQDLFPKTNELHLVVIRRMIREKKADWI